MTDRPSSETPPLRSSTDDDDVVDLEQAMRVRRRREEIQADEQRRRDRDPHELQSVPNGGIAEFENDCRLCGRRFTYRGVALVLPNMPPRPAFQPVRVCDTEACREQDARERAEADEARAREERAEFVERARLTYLEQVPPQYHERAAIEPACEAHIIHELRYWNPNLSVYLHGASGHGKSHQVACLVRRAVLADVTVRWVSARRLVQDALDAIRRRRDMPDVVANPCASKVLVVNDAYAETATQFAASLLGDLYDARYEAGLPIVWTSNVAPSQITNTVDRSRKDAATVATELERQRGRILEMTAPGRGILHRHEQRDWRAALASGEVKGRGEAS